MTTREDLSAHVDYFGELGINGVSKDAKWTHREDASSPPQSSTLSPEQSRTSAPEHLLTNSPSDLDAVRAHVGDCQLCKLCSTRTNIVFGVGNPNADLMFVGEAPGADEDEQGEPFVGRAGQLLTKIIEAMGFQRGDVYIANVLKCRPPNNRPPEPDEVATCEPYLFKQIDAIKPKVIVALGTHAAHALLKIDTPISKIRGKVLDFRGDVKLVPTFHPAYLLRSPDRKRDVWEDMKIVRDLLSNGR
jgi:uracil-DNA glycosylase family 4